MIEQLESIAARITPEGVYAPTYPEVYQALQEQFQSIYGSDAYIEPDSQDGQLLAITAKAIHDANQAAIAIYQSFSPATATGAALSTNVKINGIARRVATRSQVVLLLIGVAGTVIENGVVADNRGSRWTLPASVTLPPGGEIEVTAFARDLGPVVADAGTITRIVTHVRGWQSVTNELPAIPGAAAESDGALRQRQAISTSNPAQTVLKGLQGAIAAIPSVIRSEVYENDTNLTDSRGIPPHSVAVVTEGGDAQTIAQTISVRKTPGAYTHGSSAVLLLGPGSLPETIRFFYAEPVQARVAVTITPRPGFVTATMALIKQAIADYINALGIGRRVDQGRLFLPAQLYGTAPQAPSFEVESIHLIGEDAPPIDSDLAIAYNQIATCVVDDVAIYTVGA